MLADFRGVKIPLEYLPEVLGRIRRREFSIAGSSIVSSCIRLFLSFEMRTRHVVSGEGEMLRTEEYERGTRSEGGSFDEKRNDALTPVHFLLSDCFFSGPPRIHPTLHRHGLVQDGYAEGSPDGTVFDLVERSRDR